MKLVPASENQAISSGDEGKQTTRFRAEDPNNGLRGGEVVDLNSGIMEATDLNCIVSR
ncbi:uncharacterized protein G2W53_002024 [Senna tora]|uniref:Uncharacterized protein n=1 Tax=Senna tora TaxID=362788 RepID=A0A834XIX8_9FABA|nr:uncharacterized protein G2W53_002024 [Senna tora]